MPLPSISIILMVVLVGCQKQAGQCGGAVPPTASLNAFAISYVPTKVCADAALVDARVEAAKGRDGRFAQSQQEHDQGITAHANDEVAVDIFFDNSGADFPQNMARNVHAMVTINSEHGLTHRISTKLLADNTPTVGTSGRGGDIVVHTRDVSRLEYVRGTTTLCITRQEAIDRSFESIETCGLYGTNVLVHLPDGQSPSNIPIGNLQPGFPHNGDIEFKLKVIKIQ